jgi:hypothetical protein
MIIHSVNAIRLTLHVVSHLPRMEAGFSSEIGRRPLWPPKCLELVECRVRHWAVGCDRNGCSRHSTIGGQPGGPQGWKTPRRLRVTG